MIFTAYFDESGTHAGAELTAMAGFLGDRRQWRKFEKRTGKLFKRFHVDVFHAIDVRRSDKDFAGWSVDRKIEFFDEFQHVINETLESGVAAFLRHEDYRYYCGGSRSAKVATICWQVATDSKSSHSPTPGASVRGRHPPPSL